MLSSENPVAGDLVRYVSPERQSHISGHFARVLRIDYEAQTADLLVFLHGTPSGVDGAFYDADGDGGYGEWRATLKAVPYNTQWGFDSWHTSQDWEGYANSLELTALEQRTLFALARHNRCLAVIAKTVNEQDLVVLGALQKLEALGLAHRKDEGFSGGSWRLNPTAGDWARSKIAMDWSLGVGTQPESGES
jgi:hypothetical protein